MIRFKLWLTTVLTFLCVLLAGTADAEQILSENTHGQAGIYATTPAVGNSHTINNVVLVFYSAYVSDTECTGVLSGQIISKQSGPTVSPGNSYSINGSALYAYATKNGVAQSSVKCVVVVFTEAPGLTTFSSSLNYHWPIKESGSDFIPEDGVGNPATNIITLD
ncbi:MAG: hypothetical protein P1U34_09990 [Coxiellaceae bacterium]|nr:hypothetical protein [Coxiellaceae bacterium]